MLLEGADPGFFQRGRGRASRYTIVPLFLAKGRARPSLNLPLVVGTCRMYQLWHDKILHTLIENTTQSIKWDGTQKCLHTDNTVTPSRVLDGEKKLFQFKRCYMEKNANFLNTSSI